MVELTALRVGGLIGGGFAMGAIWMAMLVGILAMKGRKEGERTGRLGDCETLRKGPVRRAVELGQRIVIPTRKPVENWGAE